jgi:hypothetical protein
MPTLLKNKTTRADAIRKVCAGLTKYYSKATLVLAGTSYTPAALQKFLQSDIDDNDASSQARAEWLNAVKVAQDTNASTDPVLRAINAMVSSQYAEASNADTVFADFGYTPRKKVVKTVATKAAAVAKSTATRAARHTMGKRQKADVKGTLPVTEAEGASASASPPNGSSGGTPASGSSTPATPAVPASSAATATPHA